MFNPRAGGQSEVMSYRGGWMGVSAVPGSGKTETLSNLAARLIQDGAVGDGQEVLIVTFANSAVQNFESRIRRILDETGLLAIGYRVRTLHGLCHDIIRERPSLVGLADDFQIADERVTGGILTDAAEAWVRAHPDAGQEWLDPDLNPGQVQKVLRDGWPDLVKKIGYQFIKTAKDLQANPPAVRHRLEEIHTRLPLLEMGLEIYSDYQKALSYRGAVDFDDLIRLAVAALEQDADYLARLRARWPFILEDEAQDSNLLQEGILSRLAGLDGNWVRVGDPNQAIYETFTTASPRYLRAFITRVEQKPELLYSGRSTQTIMGLANALVEWSRRDHPVMDLSDTLAETLIHATPLGDPQPNPPDDPLKVSIQRKPLSPDDELNRVVKSVRRWLDDPRHEMETLAILAFQNDRGAAFVDRFNRDGIPCIEVLKSTQETRRAAQAISSILHCLAWPDQSSPLDRAYRDWLAFRNERQPEGAVEDSLGSRVISRIKNPEEYLWSAGWEALPGIQAARQTAPAVFETLAAFREAARRWQAAVHLPIDQLVVTIAPDLFSTPADLALAHKIAAVLGSVKVVHPALGLKELAEEVDRVAHNQSKLVGFAGDDEGFEPEDHKGKVVVSTVHRAKGLEWDRVYLTSVNNYDFPSALPQDYFQSEKWFIRSRLNLEAETISRLRALLCGDVAGWSVEEGEATRQARLDTAAERLRLLYVGITRAKKELVITWNTGTREDKTEAAPLAALAAYLEERQRESAG